MFQYKLCIPLKKGHAGRPELLTWVSMPNSPCLESKRDVSSQHWLEIFEEAALLGHPSRHARLMHVLEA